MIQIAEQVVKGISLLIHNLDMLFQSEALPFIQWVNNGTYLTLPQTGDQIYHFGTTITSRINNVPPQMIYHSTPIGSRCQDE